MKTPKTFEEGMQRLQQLMEQMQDETTSLNDAVKLYAEAAQLIAYCNQTLAGAKLKIEEIDAQLGEQLPAGAGEQ